MNTSGTKIYQQTINPNWRPFDILLLEIGQGLVGSCGDDCKNLCEHITHIRETISRDMGFCFPRIRIIDNLKLEPNEYVFTIRGVEAARYNFAAGLDMYLCIHTNTQDEVYNNIFYNLITGVQTPDPVFGIPARWIAASEQELSKRAGYMVATPLDVMATHLCATIEDKASEIFTIEMTLDLLSSLKEKYPGMVEKISRIFLLSDIHKILLGLLEEQVSIRNIVTILESMINGQDGKDKDFSRRGSSDLQDTIEECRQALKEEICRPYTSADKKLQVTLVHQSFEKELVEYLGKTPDKIPDIDFAVMKVKIFFRCVELLKHKSYSPVFLCSESVRPVVRLLLPQDVRNLAVFSASEIADDISVEVVGEFKIFGSGRGRSKKFPYSIIRKPNGKLDLYPENSKKHPRTAVSSMDELNALVGLAEVKTKIHEIATFLERRGKERLPCIHMVFRGNPGTGKTLVARLLGRIFADLGITRSGDTFIETDREGLVAGYVGQTAIKTADRIREAMGGVLFIDEAYLLNMNSGNDFGHECIATLTKRMEDCRNDFICIMAGYAAQMDKMLNLNPGLRERVQFYIDFPDYSAAELLQIFKDLCGTNRYTLERTAENLLSEQLAKVIAGKDENFSNARIVRKLFERVQIQQALRTTDMEIQAADISLAFRSSDIVPLVEGRGASRIGFAG